MGNDFMKNISKISRYKDFHLPQALILKAVFVLKIFKRFCPDFFGHEGKRLDKKATVSFLIYNVTDWETNNYNIDIAQYLKK